MFSYEFLGKIMGRGGVSLFIAICETRGIFFELFHSLTHSPTCRELKKQLQHLAKKINPTTHRSLRQEYFVHKKKYKKQVKLMHKKYKNELMNEINALRVRVTRKQINFHFRGKA